MELREYEVALSQRESVARVRAAERIIRREGGKITLTSLEATGLVLVTLSLPAPLTPDRYFPDIPFYPV
jgi:hypothetical protein